MTIFPQVRRGGGQSPDEVGVFLDGHSAKRHEVEMFVNVLRGCLQIRSDDVNVDWPLEDVRRVRDQAGARGMVLRLADDPTPRLICVGQDLAGQFPKLKKGVTHVTRGRLLRWAVGAIASVALIILVLVPLMANQLAAYIPAKGERALGDATLTQIRNALSQSDVEPLPFCGAQDGQAALNKMQDRLQASMALEIPLSVHVLNHEMVNAFALPGGHIVLFRGLIEAATTPEEVAAVFAHEMGHVVSRDPTRHALRSAGSIGVLGLLFGDFAGGAMVLFLTEQLIEARYSQKAEAGADTFAYDVLQTAGVAPSALGDMFETFRARFGGAEGIQAHFLSHPKLSARIDAANAATPIGFTPQLLLNDTEWQALREICGP